MSVSSLLALFALTFSCVAHPLDLWYSRFTNSPVTTFWGTAYGGGRYVAVGASGAIANSTNGIQWTVSYPSAQVLNGVTYGSDKFAVVGYGGTILISSNGVTWQNRSPGTNIYFQKVAYGNSRFVAVGYTITPAASYSMVSMDGISWTNYFLTTSKPAGGLAFANGLFIYPLEQGSNLLSADGISWWGKPSGTTNDLYTIGSGGNTFVAFDIRSRTYKSTDGTNWLYLGTNSLLRPEGLAYGNGFWVVVCRDIAANYSSDLVHWMAATNSNTGATSTCFGDGTFITAGGVICQSASVNFWLQAVANTPGAIYLYGPTGRTYRIQTLDGLGATNWQTVSNLTLDISPFLWTDPDDTAHSQKFYRAVWP